MVVEDRVEPSWSLCVRHVIDVQEPLQRRIDPDASKMEGDGDDGLEVLDRRGWYGSGTPCMTQRR
jgi:hypothetical protein